MVDQCARRTPRVQAGILKRGTPAVTVAAQAPEAMATLEAAAQHAGAPLYLAPPMQAYAVPAGGLTLGLAGDFQRENAALAAALARLFAVRCAPWLLARGASGHATAALWAQQCSAAWAHEAGRWSPWAAGEGPGAGPAAPQAHDGGAAAARAVTGPAGELTREEADGLAATRWPGRAQVLIAACCSLVVLRAVCALRGSPEPTRPTLLALPCSPYLARLP